MNVRYRGLAASILALAMTSATTGALAQEIPTAFEAPLVRLVQPVDTCAFANASLQAAFEGHWAQPRQAVPAQLQGQTKVTRYGDMIVASIQGKAKSFRGVKAEYEKRLAALSSCTVTIQGRTYGLDGILEDHPANPGVTDVDAVYRLRDAPDYLSDLRVRVNSYWSNSAWTDVVAGRVTSVLEGPGLDVLRTEQRLARNGLTWRPISDAGPSSDPLAALSIDQLLASGDTLVSRARDETETPVNWRVRAVPFFDSACRRGSMLACGRKGWLMSQAVAGPNAIGLAAPYLEKGCSVKDAGSCHQLAGRLLVGFPSAETRKRAIDLIFEACDLSSGAACGQAADSLLTPEPGATPDWPRIVKLYGRGCGLQDPWACYRGATVYYAGSPGVAKDWEQARSMFTAGCGGVGTLIAKSCRYAGVMYFAGQGGEKSEDLAKLMLKRGCDKYDADSCKALNLPLPQ